MGKSKRSFCLKALLIFIAFTISFFYPAVNFSAHDGKSVLFISSYDDGNELVAEEIKGVQNILKEENITLDTEFMDTKRIDTQENIDNFYETLKFKMENLPRYDAIIVADDPALQFAIEHQEELFNDLPIIFMGINDLEVAEVASEDKYITGIRQDTSLEENIRIALNINPEATKIVALVDGTLTGVGDKDQFYINQGAFPDIAFSDIDSSKYTFDEVAVQLQEIGNDTIVFYLNMGVDKTGETKTISHMVEMIVDNTNVPIYRATVGGVGEGLLGGLRVSFVKMGEEAAKMVVDIFNGTPVETIDMIYETPREAYFDYKVIKKFNIDLSLLPDNAVVINKEPTFFEEYKELALYALMIFCFLVIIIIIAVFDNIRRRKIQRKIKETNQELSDAILEITAIEEELRSQYETSQDYLKDLELLNQKYEIAVKVTDSAVWELDLYTKKISVSSNFADIIEQQVEIQEDIDKFLGRVFQGEFFDKIYNEYINIRDGFQNEVNIQLPIKVNNKFKWVLVRGQGVNNSNNEISLIYGIVLDITALKEQEHNIEKLAKHDYLTALPNRRYFISKLSEELLLKDPCAVMLLDIDNFKEINDTLGHLYGDKILKEFARNLVEDLGQNNIFISRFGGDEFVILVTGVNDKKQIEEYVKKYKLNKERIININNIDNYVSFSIGISRYPYDGDTSDKLIMNADTAMYKVKNSGKKNYTFYSEEMNKELLSKTGIETILRNALKEDGYYLVYQPQICVKTGEIIALEALIRLKNHKIPPDVFIKVAEDTDLIIDIGRFVTREVISQVAKWKSKGLDIKKVSINYSSKQLRDKEYLEYIKKTLNEFKVDPSVLEIEITENILLEKNEVSIEFLESLNKAGISIALDDFGRGYSSINYLTYIPVDKVKLDKSLCDKFLYMENIDVMNSIISLAHSFKLKITAEGIEEEIQYQRLKKANCDYIQGYFFCKPLVSEEIETIYNKNFLES